MIMILISKSDVNWIVKLKKRYTEKLTAQFDRRGCENTG